MGHPLRTDFWTRCSPLKPLAEWGAITEQDLDSPSYADTPVDAFEQLRDHLITHHLNPPTEQEAAAPGIAKTRGEQPNWSIWLSGHYERVMTEGGGWTRRLVRP